VQQPASYSTVSVLCLRHRRLQITACGWGSRRRSLIRTRPAWARAAPQRLLAGHRLDQHWIASFVAEISAMRHIRHFYHSRAGRIGSCIALAILFFSGRTFDSLRHSWCEDLPRCPSLFFAAVNFPLQVCTPIWRDSRLPLGTTTRSNREMAHDSPTRRNKLKRGKLSQPARTITVRIQRGQPSASSVHSLFRSNAFTL